MLTENYNPRAEDTFGLLQLELNKSTKSCNYKVTAAPSAPPNWALCKHFLEFRQCAVIKQLQQRVEEIVLRAAAAQHSQINMRGTQHSESEVEREIAAAAVKQMFKCSN